MAKKKRIQKREAPVLQFGATRDTVEVLRVLDARLEQALVMGREVTAQELAREIGKLGGVNNVNITNSTFNG